MLNLRAVSYLSSDLHMCIKKFCAMSLFTFSALCSEITSQKTSHFKICATQQNSKIVVKYDDLVSSEIECANIYQSKAKEISKNELILSSVIGHGTGFNIEKLFIIQVSPVENFIKKIFSNKKHILHIYNISNAAIFNQLRKRTKFEVTNGKLKIFIDGQEKYKGNLLLEGDYYIDYCKEYFAFNLDDKLSITINICKKKKDEANYPDFVGSITFDVSYKVKNNKIEFILSNPQIEV